MTQSIESFRLPNGLTVLVEKMPDVQSAAMTLLVPAGCVQDLPGKCGTGSILTEMLPRGASGYSAREYCSRLDNLGLQRNVSIGTSHITFTGATTADRLNESIQEFARMILAPHLADEEFEPARDLVEQSLTAMEDEPRQRLGKALRQHSFAAPWGNSAEGELNDLPNITIADVRRHFHELICPNESILGIAGNVDSEQVREIVSNVFETWTPKSAPPIRSGERLDPMFHMHHESAQTHIGLSWESVPYHHPLYYDAWAAVSLLSGGMSSRLFTEVREKRGLCYAISASLNTLRDEGRVFAYAGTTNERAQETLDVTVAEIRRLHEGITDDELQRCKARAKSALIMQQESTTSRASSMARDVYHLGRVVTLDEIHSKIDGLTTDSVRNFIVSHAPRSMVLVTIGPQSPDSSCVTALGQ
ncbi:MAG: insulinase family protein [Planctomyces sp.]|nr:insulinase family protein [Planctomyces sp.]